MVRILRPSVWLEGALQALHAYAEACENKRPLSHIR